MCLVRPWIVALIAVSSALAYPQNASTGPTVPAPLEVEQWLQAPPDFDVSWDGLRGKVVVLEFWATWCSPCIAAIPHLNQLASEFKRQGVVFVAITDDGADRLGPFLQTHDIDAMIGIDTKRKTWSAFDVPSIPHAVLIARDGTVIGATQPDKITGEVLREALAGNRPVLMAKEGVPSDLEWDDHLIGWQDGVPPAMYAIIKPIKTLTSGVWRRPGHFTADGVPLQSLVQAAYEVDSYHIDWRIPKDELFYRVAFKLPLELQDHLLAYMRETVSEFFGLHARWEEQSRETYVLRRSPDAAPLPESSTRNELVQMRRGRIVLRRQPIGKLVEMVQNALHFAVVNESGLDRSYDFDLPYQPGQPEVIIQALRSSGFTLAKARSNLKVLVVDRNP